MGLFKIFKRKEKPKTESNKSKSLYITELDLIEKEVYTILKPLGFRKNGRTLNRKIFDGIIQVIHFQSGQKPLVENYTIPGLRENMYGKFAINLGVCIESLYKIQYPTENKKYYKEYDCQIRDRLGNLLKGQDYWWTITNDNDKIKKEIIVGLETKGFEWFSGIDTKKKIINNYGRLPYRSTPSAKLDIALIVWIDDKAKGSELFREYYNNIESRKTGHKAYVKDLAKELNIHL